MTKTATPEIGSTVMVWIEVSKDRRIQVPCVLLDRRQLFGRQEFQIAPVGGEGQAWITESRIV